MSQESEQENAFVEYRRAVHEAAEAILGDMANDRHFDDKRLRAAILQHLDGHPQVAEHSKAVQALTYSSHATAGLADGTWIGGDNKPFPFTMFAAAAFGADIEEVVRKLRRQTP